MAKRNGDALLNDALPVESHGMTRSIHVPSAASSGLGVGRRQAPRVPAALDCEVAWGQESVLGSLIDLSMGGAAVGLSLPLPLSEGDGARLILGAQDQSVVMDASLVTQSEETFGTFVARLKFAGAQGGPEFQRILAECVEAFRGAQVAVFQKHL